MLEKIDKFIDKFLKWDVIEYILLMILCLIPHHLIINKYGIDGFDLITMMISFGLSFGYCEKALKNFFE